MFENRSLKLDLFSLVLLVTAALLAASLLTYDATDPPSTLVYPVKATVSNACGMAGAHVAHWLFSSVGYAAVYVIGSIVAAALLLIYRSEVDQPVLRGFGWAASLVSLTTLATMALPHTSPGPEIGAGGYLGAMGFAVLESHFAAFGAYVLAFAVLLAGLLLATDYVLLRFATSTAMVSGAGLARVGRVGGMMTSLSSDRTATDQDEEEYEYDYEEEDDAGDDEEEEYEYEEEAEDEDDELEDEEEAEWEDDEEEADEEPDELTVKTSGKKTDEEEIAEAVATASSVASGLKNKLTSALRIKNPNTKRNERAEIIDQLQAADQQGVDDLDFQLPPLDLLLPAEDVNYDDHEREVRRRAKVLEKTFKTFGFDVKVVEIETGPVIAQYELELAAGLRLSKITGLADDIAVALRVPGVRIVAPIPGKNSVGIEVPNETRQIVRLREVIEETNGKAKRMHIPIYLGKDVTGNPMVVDLAKLPHLLIAGRTGTGKSVCLNSIIVSMLMSRGPDEVRMLMIDPKMVELSGYKKLPHLMHPVVTDMRKAEAILAWAVDKMEERYQLLARAGVRQISVYNQLSEDELRERIVPRSEAEWETIPKSLPYIVIVADEMADLIMTAGKDVQDHIIRLAQKSRAVGIHLILATQKPTVDVITGLIKSNLPARIAFQVASRTDSQVVLDANGADKLLGNGDMLFLSPGTSTLLRGQGTFLSDDEITEITDFVGTDDPQFDKELSELKTKEEQEAAGGNKKADDRDELYNDAVEIVIREQRGSVSLLQRAMSIGYGRAARLIDFMAEDGIVAEYNGQKARQVVMTMSQWEAQNGEEPAEIDHEEPVTAVTVPPKPPRPTKIIPRREQQTLTSDQKTARDLIEEAEEEDESAPKRSRAIRIDHAEETKSFGSAERASALAAASTTVLSAAAGVAKALNTESAAIADPMRSAEMRSAETPAIETPAVANEGLVATIAPWEESPTAETLATVMPPAETEPPLTAEEESASAGPALPEPTTTHSVALANNSIDDHLADTDELSESVGLAEDEKAEDEDEGEYEEEDQAEEEAEADLTQCETKATGHHDDTVRDTVMEDSAEATAEEIAEDEIAEDDDDWEYEEEDETEAEEAAEDDAASEEDEWEYEDDEADDESDEDEEALADDEQWEYEDDDETSEDAELGAEEEEELAEDEEWEYEDDDSEEEEEAEWEEEEIGE